MSSLIGQTLGRYHVLEQLGEGGMAIVYKAFDTRLETEVALKVIRTDNIPPRVLERAIKRFDREAKALAKLTHPNIVKVIDYGEHEGHPYLVMPCLPGGTLKEKITGKPIPWQEAARLLIPIARALDFAHRQGMVHRDVKPSNIIIAGDGDPMLTDFGIAKILNVEETFELTGTNASIGTPEYMAPEQSTSSKVDHRADIYALGVVLYEMVAGRKPFIADTPMAVLIKQASEPLPRLKQFVADLPQAVENVLLKALTKAPEHRYQSMGDFGSALEALISGTPSSRANSGMKMWNRKSFTWLIARVIGIGLIGIIFATEFLGNNVSTNSTPEVEITIGDAKTTKTPMKTKKPSTALVVAPTVLPKTSTPTLAPIDLPVSDLLPGREVVYQTDFNNMVEFIDEWQQYESVELSSGLLVISKDSGVKYKTRLSAGNGILALFRCTSGVDGNIVYFNSLGNANKYIGIKPGFSPSIKISLGYDDGWHGGQSLSGNMTFKEDRWYYALVEIKSGGEFYMKVIDAENSKQFIEKSMPMGSDWEKESWYGSITTNEHNQGKIEVDKYLVYKTLP